MGIVLVHTTVSLDGFTAGPNHGMDWIFDSRLLPNEPIEAIEDVIRTTGAILAGRGTYDVGRRSARSETGGAFGGRWSGPQVVLTHRPPTDEEDREVTFLSGASPNPCPLHWPQRKARTFLFSAPTLYGSVSTRIWSTRSSFSLCPSCSATESASSVRLVAGRSRLRPLASSSRVRWRLCVSVGRGSPEARRRRCRCSAVRAPARQSRILLGRGCSVPVTHG